MKKQILLLFLTFLTFSVFGQQATLPAGSVPYGSQYYKAPDGSVWMGASGKQYTRVTEKRMLDSLATVVTASLALKENSANKSTSLASPNNTTFPTTQAVSTGLALKENVANKSTSTALGTSNTLYPTQNAVKIYIDNAVSSSATPDATTLVKGKVKLAGDLSGTADLPTVPALTNKVDKEAGKGLSAEDYTTAEKAKLAGIAAGAEVNVNADWNASTGDAAILNKPATTSNLAIGTRTTTTVPITNDNGTGATIPSATTTLAGVMPSASLVKLNGIATGATANQTDAYLLSRANHTGTQSISTVTGLQTALDDKIPLAQKGVNNGVATLDGGGKVPVEQLPTGSQVYKGTWDASTNTPTLADGAGTAGWTYRVSVGGTRNLGSGNINFVAGDDVIYNGTVWKRIPSSSSVTSVNGQQGAVVLGKSDIGLGNADNTSDINKPVSTATQTALNLKEDAANKSTTTTLGTSNTLYPTQNAVKVYVDNAITGNTGVSNLGIGTRTSTTLPLTNSNGTGVTLPVATSSLAGLFSAADFSKLSGIAAGATANVGTVTSVGLAVPTGMTVIGTPVTGAGTLTLGYAAGYSLPTVAKQTNWDAAFSWGNHAGLYPTYNGTGANGTWGINVTGNSGTATALETPRTINGVSFDGTANITVSDATKEPTANKSTATALGTSNVLFPTQNAVKVYVDNAVSGISGASNLALGTRTSTTMPITNSNGTGFTLPVSTSTLAGLQSAADFNKLSGITGTNTGDQTLSIGDYGTDNFGLMSISGGNTIPIQGLTTYLRQDGFENPNKSSLAAFMNSAGSTNYPNATGGGILYNRYSTPTSNSGFRLWTSTSADENLYINFISGNNSYSPDRIIATREWSNDQFYTQAQTNSKFIGNGTANGAVLTDEGGLDVNNIVKTNSGYLTTTTNLPVSTTGLVSTYYRPLSGGSALQTNLYPGTEDSFWYRKKLNGAWGSWFQHASREWVQSLGLGITANIGSSTIPSNDANISTHPSGFYATSTTTTGIPVTASGSIIIERTGASGYVTQKFQPIYATDQDDLYIRHYKPTLSAWSPWKKLYHEGNFTPGDYLPLTGGTLTGNLGLGVVVPAEKLDVLGNAQVSGILKSNQEVRISGAAGNNRILRFSTGSMSSSLPRWTILTENTPETGSNVGSDLIIARYSDAGSSLGQALSINRSTGNSVFGGNVTGARFLADNAGSATTPSISWADDLNTGIYNSAADQISITTGGVARASFNNTGLTMGSSLNVTITAAPTLGTHATNKDYVDGLFAGATPSTRSIVAGNGLTGGGDLTANRTLTLGTPGATTLTSTNAVTSTSHTHAFTPGGTTAQYIRGDGSLATLPTSAATLTTPRTIWGQSFNGSANVTGALSGATTINASTSVTAPTINTTNIVTTDDLYFKTGSAEKIHVNATGVAINGNPNPVRSSALEVNGNVWSTDAYILGTGSAPTAEFGLDGNVFLRSMGAQDINFLTGATNNRMSISGTTGVVNVPGKLTVQTAPTAANDVVRKTDLDAVSTLQGITDKGQSTDRAIFITGSEGVGTATTGLRLYSNGVVASIIESKIGTNLSSGFSLQVESPTNSGIKTINGARVSGGAPVLPDDYTTKAYVDNANYTRPIAVKTANYTLTDNDYTIITKTGALTFTLPSAVGRTGRIFRVINYSNNTMTVNCTAAQLVTSDTSAVNPAISYGGAVYKTEWQSDGTNWYLIGGE